MNFFDGDKTDDLDAPVLSDTEQELAAFVEEAMSDGPEEEEAPASGAANPDPGDAKEADADPDGDTVGADKPAQEDPAPTDQPAKADDDPWKDVPPELRARYENLQEQLTRTKGQLSAADRALNLARNQPRPDAAELAATEKADVKALLGSEKITQLRAEYGEVADPLLDIIEGLAGELDRVKGTVQHVETDRDETFLTEQLKAYEKDHPDWQEFAKPQAGFSDWIATQPRHIREAAARNVEYIVDAAEASDVLSRFKAFKGEASADPSPEPSPTADPRRQRQLDGALNVRASAPAAQGGESDDPDLLFAKAAATVDKARGIKS